MTCPLGNKDQYIICIIDKNYVLIIPESILNSVDMLVTHAIPIRLRVAWQGPPLASQITACSDLPHVQYR